MSSFLRMLSFKDKNKGEKNYIQDSLDADYNYAYDEGFLEISSNLSEYNSSEYDSEGEEDDTLNIGWIMHELREKIFEFESRNCDSCLNDATLGHICFSEFSGHDYEFCLNDYETCESNNEGILYGQEAVQELYDSKKITRHQAYVLDKICKYNLFFFPCFLIEEWKFNKKFN